MSKPTVPHSERFGSSWRSLRLLTTALVLFAALVFTQAASANTYYFTIPIGTQTSPSPNSLMWALAGAVANDGLGDHLTQFAFYDFYVRPQIAADPCLVSVDNCGSGDPHGENMSPVVAGNTFNLITDYTSMVSATAPVPGCVSPIASNCTSTYDATLNVTNPTAAGGNTAHFRFDGADNTIALVTENPNAGNQTYVAGGNNPFPTGATTEIMTSATNLTFSFNTSQYSTFQTPVITFQIYALAIKYTAVNGTILAGKDQAFQTNLDLVGTAPEPSTMLVAGFGLALMVVLVRRRRVTPLA